VLVVNDESIFIAKSLLSLSVMAYPS